jgi:CheY-like chemotaxis protein
MANPNRYDIGTPPPVPGQEHLAEFGTARRRLDGAEAGGHAHPEAESTELVPAGVLAGSAAAGFAPAGFPGAGFRCEASDGDGGSTGEDSAAGTPRGQGQVTTVPPRLLVVDDDRDVGSLVSHVAESCGFEARSMQDPTRFQSLYRELDPDVIILDVIMPRIDGIELLRFLADERARARILIFATADRRMMELAVNLGRAYGLKIIGIISKPIRVEELRVRLNGLRD